jgi:hypothetical protein
MEPEVITTLPASPASPELTLERLDAIIRELQDLRRTLIMQSPGRPTSARLTQRLSGILAPSVQNENFDVWEEYRAISDWERFA